jgi:hypothetical protein
VRYPWSRVGCRWGRVGCPRRVGGLLPGEAVRRVACDATVTRAVVRRHTDDCGAGGGDSGLAARLQRAVALLPAPLGTP